MGRIYLEHLGGSKVFVCAECNTFLTNNNELYSNNIRGNRGSAYLFKKVVNVTYSESTKNKYKHFVKDVFCKKCNTILGSYYEFVPNENKHWHLAVCDKSISVQYLLSGRPLSSTISGSKEKLMMLAIQFRNFFEIMSPLVNDIWSRLRSSLTGMVSFKNFVIRVKFCVILLLSALLTTIWQSRYSSPAKLEVYIGSRSSRTVLVFFSNNSSAEKNCRVQIYCTTTPFILLPL